MAVSGRRNPVVNTAPEPSSVKRALAGHAAIGLLSGALLYIVCLTGTVAVFLPELQRLEQSDAPEMAAIAPASVQRGMEAMLEREKGQPKTTHVFVHLPVSNMPRAMVSTDRETMVLGAHGSIVGPQQHGWADFLLALHYTLNLPGLVGMTLVGALGVMILALSIGGIIAHPRIFRDAFTLRARDHSGLGLADWHNRLSVWTLPFSSAIALTGAVIGLGSVTAWGLAALFESGKVEQVYAPLFGAEGKPDPRPAEAPNVVAVLEYMARHQPTVTPTYVTVHEPLTIGQEVQVTARHPRRLIFGENYRFDAQGRFLGTAGLADGPLGQQAAGSNYSLHFGDYGGLAVKLAYVLFGAALTAICATGVFIWLGKRRRRGYHEPRLLRLWDAVVWGTPSVLCATLMARLVLGNALPFAALFWGGLAILLVLAVLSFPPRAFRRSLQAVSAASILMSALLLA
jgi:uncharacterized iron-regulated membrane protein